MGMGSAHPATTQWAQCCHAGPGDQDKDVGINILAQDSLLGVVLVMVDIEYRDSYADNQSWSRPSVHYTLPLLWSAAVCVLARCGSIIASVLKASTVAA